MKLDLTLEQLMVVEMGLISMKHDMQKSVVYEINVNFYKEKGNSKMVKGSELEGIINDINFQIKNLIKPTMPYQVGHTETIYSDEYKIVSAELVKDDIYLITCKIIKKNGELGKKTAIFFSDRRVTSLKIYRS